MCQVLKVNIVVFPYWICCLSYEGHFAATDHNPCPCVQHHISARSDSGGTPRSRTADLFSYQLWSFKLSYWNTWTNCPSLYNIHNLLPGIPKPRYANECTWYFNNSFTRWVNFCHSSLYMLSFVNLHS